MSLRSGSDDRCFRRNGVVMTQTNKRIKRVFPNRSEVLHRWSNQTQDDARCANVFFEGKVAYSYGRHYTLGRLITVRGQTVALINFDKYSNTTRKHSWSAWYATEHLLRVKCENVPLNLKAGLLETQDELIKACFEFFTMRSPYWNARYMRDAFKAQNRDTVRYFEDYRLANRIAEFNAVCDATGHSKLRIDLPKEFIQWACDRQKLLKAREAASQSPEAIAEREAKRVKREARALERAREQVEDWKRGTGVLPDAVRYSPTVFLRIRGEVIESSRGATVPLPEARTFLKRLLAGKAEPGDAVGPYSFRGLEGDVLHIGCHALSLDEARAVLGASAPQLSLVSGGAQ
jgi:hypothetical protein